MFYLDDNAAIDRAVDRLRSMGYPPGSPENQYWSAAGAVTIEDPDAWRVVFMQTERGT